MIQKLQGDKHKYFLLHIQQIDNVEAQTSETNVYYILYS